MKKCFLTCIVSLGFLLNVNAQTEYGVKGGLNYSNNIIFSNTDFDSFSDYKIGFHLGFLMKKELSHKWNLKPEILFSRKGFQNKITTINGETSKVKTNLDYLNMPIIFEYNIVDRLFVEMGAEVGYLLEEPTEFFNNIDVGLSGGLVFYLNDKISLNTRFTQGLLSVVKDTVELVSEDGFTTETTVDAYFLNRNFQFSINYIFM